MFGIYGFKPQGFNASVIGFRFFIGSGFGGFRAPRVSGFETVLGAEGFGFWGSKLRTWDLEFKQAVGLWVSHRFQNLYNGRP